MKTVDFSYRSGELTGGLKQNIRAIRQAGYQHLTSSHTFGIGLWSNNSFNWSAFGQSSLENSFGNTNVGSYLLDNYAGWPELLMIEYMEQVFPSTKFKIATTFTSFSARVKTQPFITDENVFQNPYDPLTTYLFYVIYVANNSESVTGLISLKDRKFEVFVPHPAIWDQSAEMRMVTCEMIRFISMQWLPDVKLSSKGCDELSNVHVFNFCENLPSSNMWNIYYLLMKTEHVDRTKIQAMFRDCDNRTGLVLQALTSYQRLGYLMAECLPELQKNVKMKLSEQDNKNLVEKMQSCKILDQRKFDAFKAKELEPIASSTSSTTRWPKNADSHWHRFEETKKATNAFFAF